MKEEVYEKMFEFLEQKKKKQPPFEIRYLRNGLKDVLQEDLTINTKMSFILNQAVRLNRIEDVDILLKNNIKSTGRKLVFFKIIVKLLENCVKYNNLTILNFLVKETNWFNLYKEQISTEYYRHLSILTLNNILKKQSIKMLKWVLDIDKEFLTTTDRGIDFLYNKINGFLFTDDYTNLNETELEMFKIMFNYLSNDDRLELYLKVKHRSTGEDGYYDINDNFSLNYYKNILQIMDKIDKTLVTQKG